MADKARYDIQYDNVKLRLSIRCNFPELEVGAKHTFRNWVGPRALARFVVIKKLVEAGNDTAVHKYISAELKVGSVNFTPPAPVPAPRPPEVDGMLRELGKMED